MGYLPLNMKLSALTIVSLHPPTPLLWLPQVRVGIHTGPVVTGVIGLKLPKFSVFGMCQINVMCSRVQISHGDDGHVRLLDCACYAWLCIQCMVVHWLCILCMVVFRHTDSKYSCLC